MTTLPLPPSLSRRRRRHHRRHYHIVTTTPIKKTLHEKYF